MKLPKKKKIPNHSQSLLYKALEDKYNSEISAAEATVDIYFTNSVGIGEHPQHLEELDKQINKIANAEDNLDVLHAYFGDTGEDKE